MGIGQEAYREFRRILRQAVSDLKVMLGGEDYSTVELDIYFDDVYNAFSDESEQNEIPNRDMWLGRAEQDIQDAKEDIRDHFTIAETGSQAMKTVESSWDEDGEIEEVSESEADGYLFGFRIVNSSIREEAKQTNNVQIRKRVETSLGGLQEYLNGFPRYIVFAIEEVKDEFGRVLGYRVWVLRDT